MTTTLRSLFPGLAILGLALSPIAAVAADSIPETETPQVIVSTATEPVAQGKFLPTWDSLKQYQVPDWFRDAKFGIWAHWGPQCQPEAGDWYARNMYLEGSGQYKAHMAKYGPPSTFGFKDVIHQWKAEKWDPDKLVSLYKRTGAQYFFAMANHHDNLDLWDSKYQPWNTAKVGPQKDLIAGWAKAARDQRLPFGVSVHAAHAWSWYEVAKGADKNGPQAGVPYDGKLTKADGKGLWWDGLDPQDLYEQRHEPSKEFQNGGKVHSRWNWGNGVSQPDQAYCEKFYNRTMDLINRYHPQLVYFDDTALPLWPVSDAGLKIAAHFYNTNLQTKGNAGVLFGKIPTEGQKQCFVWDIERGVPATGLPLAWQTDTCIGDWHYNRSVYDKNRYKKTHTVIHMLADIVSKNGNLLLNIPVRGDGSIDEKEEAVLTGIAEWMDVNKASIFATRPWKIFGEGPASDGAPISAQGFNEGKGKPFTPQDVRYTAGKDGNTLYVIVLGWPDKALELKSLGAAANLLENNKSITSIELLGSNETIQWKQEPNALSIATVPARPTTGASASAVFKINLK
ncbi:MAG: alpha-L-fucosidase [Candidatus Methylacidiphilales bacterium]|nr:alpha-L-fucosidase [Candidatus Methylacidiphilales bacterium]